MLNNDCKYYIYFFTSVSLLNKKKKKNQNNVIDTVLESFSGKCINN